MSTNARRWILRANAAYLLVAAVAGLRADLLGAFYGSGPMSRVLNEAPHAAIGFVEAHGLAIILGVLLWRAAPLVSWHITAAAIHVLLGTANLVFWQLFIDVDLLMVGYVTTALHWFFVALQLFAAASARTSESTRVVATAA